MPLLRVLWVCVCVCETRNLIWLYWCNTSGIHSCFCTHSERKFYDTANFPSLTIFTDYRLLSNLITNTNTMVSDIIGEYYYWTYRSVVFRIWFTLWGLLCVRCTFVLFRAVHVFLNANLFPFLLYCSQVRVKAGVFMTLSLSFMYNT